MEVFQKVHRGNVESFREGPVTQGTQGSVYRISVEGCPAAVKDITPRSLLYRRLIGRWLLSREVRIYQKLRDLPGIPEFYRQIDPDGFIIEYIQGTPLSSFHKNAPLDPEVFEKLAELVDLIHGRGVVHADLKHKKNILVTEDGTPWLIDFGAAWTQGGSWNLPRRWLYRQFHEIDLNALSKIRKRYTAGHLRPQDRARLAKRNFVEKCGTVYQSIYRLFSRKHKWRRRRKNSS